MTVRWMKTSNIRRIADAVDVLATTPVDPAKPASG
jgi:hypothetical protein